MYSHSAVLCFVLLDIAALSLYVLRVFSFCNKILQMNINHKHIKILSVIINNFLLFIVIFLQLPFLLSYLIVYLAILLQFCTMFQGDIRMFLFGSGNFMFHLMNVQMMVSAIYVLLFDVSSEEEFAPLYPSSVFITLMLVIVILEVFSRVVDKEVLRMLLKNRNQLLFATTSMMLINVYLLILSVSYNAMAYSFMAAFFLLSTGLILFGAFYTAFQHAVRMSMLLEYQRKSFDLEQELEQSYEYLNSVQTAALTDELTKVRNRRYGLGALSKQLELNIPGCVCFIDVDNLKGVNDQYGHGEGDQYILRVVREIKEIMSETDTLARVGGDEFLLLRPFKTEAETCAMMEKVRSSLSHSANRYCPSVSYGILELQSDHPTPMSEILRQTDAKMYEYKIAHRTLCTGEKST